MPILLKKETRQRLEASQKALYEGLRMAHDPQPDNGSENLSAGALEIGLIGTAAELAITACLYEVLGAKAMLRENEDFFLTASEALAKFKKLLRSRIPKTGSLTKGVTNGGDHLDLLLEKTNGFGVLFSARAHGLHAGSGVASQIVLHKANAVADFLETLKMGSKWTPYLNKIARPTTPLKERSLLIEELRKSLNSEEADEVAKSLISVFLILPDIPEDEPEWIQALERVQIAPRKKDITFLVGSLKNAAIGDFEKVGQGVEAIPVRIVGKDDPNALPIYPSHLKKEFTKPYDLWRAEIGTANSNLKQGAFHTPPIHQIYHFSAVGLGSLGIPEAELKNGLSAHDLWPFIASALCYQGTPGPVFFLISRLKSGEKGQLMRLLDEAGQLKKKLRDRVAEYLPLLTAVHDGASLSEENALFKDFKNCLERRETLSDELPSKLRSISVNLTGKEKSAAKKFVSVCSDSGNTGELVKCLLENRKSLGNSVGRIGRPILQASSDREDLPQLTSVLATAELVALHTEARKAIRDTDFALYGPRI